LRKSNSKSDILKQTLEEQMENYETAEEKAK
jgi:hypothetical protein